MPDRPRRGYRRSGNGGRAARRRETGRGRRRKRGLEERRRRARTGRSAPQPARRPALLFAAELYASRTSAGAKVRVRTVMSSCWLKERAASAIGQALSSKWGAAPAVVMTDWAGSAAGSRTATAHRILWRTVTPGNEVNPSLHRGWARATGIGTRRGCDCDGCAGLVTRATAGLETGGTEAYCLPVSFWEAMVAAIPSLSASLTAPPAGQRVLKPDEVIETAEADVEALGRHVLGQRLDLNVGGGLGRLLATATRRAAGAADRPRAGQVRTASPRKRSRSKQEPKRFGVRREPQLAGQLLVPSLRLSFRWHGDVQPPRKHRPQVVVQHRRDSRASSPAGPGRRSKYRHQSVNSRR